MAKVLQPRLRIEGRLARAGGKAFAGSGDDYAQRLLKYIPLKVSGLFPVLDSALGAYIKDPVAGISPRLVNIFVVFALIVVILIEVHRAYNIEHIIGPTRWRMQLIQSAFNVIAFALWTYTVKGKIWNNTNNPALVIILDGVFLLFAQYIPSITLREAEKSGFSVSRLEDTEKTPASSPHALGEVVSQKPSPDTK